MPQCIFYIILMFALCNQTLQAQENNKGTGKSDNEIKKKDSPVIIYGTASYYSNKFQNRKTSNQLS